MSRLATVDLRRNRLIVYSSSRTVDRMWVANGAHEVFASEVTTGEVGEAVHRMLAASRTGVPTPDLRNGPSPLEPVLTSLGLRSHRTYEKGTRSVEVEQEDSTLTVTPYENLGREGFHGMSDQAQQWEDPSPEELGRAVLAAIEQATA